MPPCSNFDKEVELIYENVNELLQEKSAPIIIVIGDFNAKLHRSQTSSVKATMEVA